MIPLHWHTEPLLLIGLLTLGWLYFLAIGPGRKILAPNNPWPIKHAVCFSLSLICGYLAVGSPLDQLGEQFLFSAHMVQHVLLIYVVPLFAYWGLPSWLLDAAFRYHQVKRIFAFLTHPLISGILFTLVFSLWHVPSWYVAALQSKTIHVVEHLTLLVSAILMWYNFLSASELLPKRAFGTQIIFIFALMVGQMPLFGILTFSTEVLYLPYSYAPRLAFFDISPLNDQILGGVVMKIANMIISIAFIGLAFFHWQKESEAPEV